MKFRRLIGIAALGIASIAAWAQVPAPSSSTSSGRLFENYEALIHREYTSSDLQSPYPEVERVKAKSTRNYQGKPCYQYDLSITALEICGPRMLQGTKELNEKLAPTELKYAAHDCYLWKPAQKISLHVCGPYVFRGGKGYFGSEALPEFVHYYLPYLPQGDPKAVYGLRRGELDSAKVKSFKSCVDCSQRKEAESMSQLVDLIQALDQEVRGLSFRIAIQQLGGDIEFDDSQGREVRDGLKRKSLDLHGLTDDEFTAIRMYANSSYSLVNSALRQKNKGLIEKYQPYIDTLNSALEKLPPYVGMVNRGAILPPEVLAQHQPGAVVTYDSYTSTSAGSGFPANHRFAIQSYRGRYIAEHGGLPNEEEVLFKPGTRFKILSREEQPNGGIQFVLKEVLPGEEESPK